MTVLVRVLSDDDGGHRRSLDRRYHRAAVGVHDDHGWVQGSMGLLRWGRRSVLMIAPVLGCAGKANSYAHGRERRGEHLERSRQLS